MTSAVSTSGAQKVAAPRADCSGLVAKSQPPLLPDQIVDSTVIACFRGERGKLGLIPSVAAQAFPGQAFGIEFIEIIVGGVGPPLVPVEHHPLLQRMQAMVGV
jgi:hypothetical protein